MSEYFPYIVIMALITYLIRMLPLTFFQKEIKSQFLFYVPYAVLGAMTFPAIFSSTDHLPAGIVGCFVGLIMAYKEKSLLSVAIASCVSAYLVMLI